MKALTREAIFEKEDLPREKVEVPEWDGFVFVRTLTGRERDKFESSIMKGKGKGMGVTLENARAKLVSLAVVDEEGNRLFSGKDVEALGEKSAKALNTVFSAASKLSGIVEADLEELTEELEENPSDSSASDLPLPSE